MSEIARKSSLDNIIEKMYVKNSNPSQTYNLAGTLLNDLYNLKMSHYFAVQDDNLPKHRAIMVFIKSVIDSLERVERKRRMGG